MTETTYEPLVHVQKDFRIVWYRCPIERSILLELMKPSDRLGWFQAGGHLTLFAITAISAVYFLAQKNWIGFVLALLEGEVVRVMILFYLSPVWATLLAFFEIGLQASKETSVL